LNQAGSRLGSFHTMRARAKMRGRKISEETRVQMSLTKLGLQGGAGEKHPMFGKQHSKETIDKMSNSKLGYKNPMFNKKHSDEIKQKMLRLRRKTKSVSVEVLNINTGEIKIYSSGKEASISLCSSPSTIVKYIKNGKLFNGIYKLLRRSVAEI